MLIVGVSDMKFSTNPNDTIVTYALGSCLGMTLYDPKLRVGAMAHFMLPLSSLGDGRDKTNPYMYTDTGVAALFKVLTERGASLGRLVAKVAGCAAPLNEAGSFRIGERNYAIVRKLLWKNNILIAGESIGGTIPRTLSLSLADGSTTVRSEGKVISI